MNNEAAIRVIQTEAECVRRAESCSRKCEECDLLMDTEDILLAYEMAVEALGARMEESNEETNVSD